MQLSICYLADSGYESGRYGNSRIYQQLCQDYVIIFLTLKSTNMKISIEVPETVFSALRKNPEEFIQEMRIASAVKWYEIGEVSQAKAAEIAGLTRSDFIQALARYRVDFMQYTAEALEMEMNNVD